MSKAMEHAVGRGARPAKTIALSAAVHERLREVRDQITAERQLRVGRLAREATFDDAVEMLLDTWAEVTP